MVHLTDAAQQRLDDYLRQIRFVLYGAATLDPDEVERDVRQHIEEELSAVAQPVNFAALNQVLERLGNPIQWISPQEVPWWRRIMLHLRMGPHDWGLAYLTLGLLICGLIALPAGPLGLILIGASFFTARAAMTLGEEHYQLLGAQRWLLYPSLVVVMGSITVLGLLWPIPPAAALADNYWRQFAAHLSEDVAIISCIACALGLWWMIIGSALLVRPQVLRSWYRPLVNRVPRAVSVSILIIGAISAAVAVFVFSRPF